MPPRRHTHRACRSHCVCGRRGSVSAAALILAFATVGAAAQTSGLAQRVEITGRSGPTADAESAQPLTVWRAADLARSGVTSARQALAFVAANMAADGPAQAVGEATGGIAEADLRGLGPERTLVLLNGRRIASHAYEAGTVDLNVIPFAALDRIEIRRDGASALHGSGAIAGVINFILRDDTSGVELSVQLEAPTRPGASSRRATLSGGLGALAQDGFNIFGVIDLRRQSALAAAQRGFARSGLRHHADGSVDTSRSSASSFPGDLDGFEPSLAAGCAPPRSVPDPDRNACRWDSAADVDLLPAEDQGALLGRLRWRLAPTLHATLEVLASESRLRSRNTATAVNGVLPESSPYWIAGRPAEEISGFGAGGIADWRVAEAGQRVNGSRSGARRVLAGIDGAVQAWPFSVALVHSTSHASDRLLAGHLDQALVQRGLSEGLLNPFAMQAPAGAAALRAAEVRGAISDARGRVNTLEAQISSPPGAPLVAGAGIEWRSESFETALLPAAARVAELGLDFATSTAGRRRAGAAFVQLNARLAPLLRAELALRHERTSDAAAVTSPLVALRWQAGSDLTLRAAAGRSYRLPTLFETRKPLRLTRLNEAFDDPLLCPDGLPASGLDTTAVCARQFLQRSGGPVSYDRPAASLQPETARHATLGLQWRRGREISVGIDLWSLRLLRGIDTINPERVLDDQRLHAQHLVRCSQLGAASAAAIADCRVAVAGVDTIAFIDTPLANLGRVSTQGIDVSLALAWGGSSGSGSGRGGGGGGAWTLTANGTYISRHRVFAAPGAAAEDSVGRYVDDLPLPRWQIAAQLGWSRADWSLTLAHRLRAEYHDAEASRRVAATRLFDVGLGYIGWKDGSLEVGIKNLSDRHPPYSNQRDTAQANYDPRLSDPSGRTLYLRIGRRY